MTGLSRRTLPSFFFFIALILGPVLACGAEILSDLFEKAHVTPLPRPRQARDFVLPDLNGDQVRLKDLRGKIVILNVWAIWCAPCREEMPSIERLHQHFRGQDLIILAVSVDMADIELVKAFAEKYNYTFTVLHDPRGDIIDWFYVRLIPVTYLIDKSGKIVGKAIGLRDWGDEHVIRLFEELLEKSEK